MTSDVNDKLLSQLDENEKNLMKRKTKMNILRLGKKGKKLLWTFLILDIS